METLSNPLAMVAVVVGMYEVTYASASTWAPHSSMLSPLETILIPTCAVVVAVKAYRTHDDVMACGVHVVPPSIVHSMLPVPPTRRSHSENVRAADESERLLRMVAFPADAVTLSAVVPFAGSALFVLSLVVFVSAQLFAPPDVANVSEPHAKFVIPCSTSNPSGCLVTGSWVNLGTSMAADSTYPREFTKVADVVLANVMRGSSLPDRKSRSRDGAESNELNAAA
jgi:hypothetical protein